MLLLVVCIVHYLCDFLICAFTGFIDSQEAAAAEVAAGALAGDSTVTVADAVVAALALTQAAPTVQVAVATVGTSSAMDHRCAATLKAACIIATGHSRADAVDPCRDRHRARDLRAPGLHAQGLHETPDRLAPDHRVPDLRVPCPALDHARVRGPRAAVAVRSATAITATVAGSEAVAWVVEREVDSIPSEVAVAAEA